MEVAGKGFEQRSKAKPARLIMTLAWLVSRADMQVNVTVGLLWACIGLAFNQPGQ